MKEQELDAFDMLARELSSLHEITPEEEEAIERAAKGDKEEVDDDEEIKDEEVEPEVEETEEEVEEEVEQVEPPKKTAKEKKSDAEDLGEYEGDIAKYVTSKLEEKLGVTLGEFTKVEDIVDELAKIVEDSSADVFANEEVSKLNEFVRNGGDLKKFYAETYNSGVDIEHIDLENTSDLKKVIWEDLKNKGYSDAQIERKISRYEDSGVLQDEGEDSVESVKAFREKNKQTLLEDTKKEAEESRKRNERYIADVQKNIKELKEIRGINISEKEKKELFQYIFIPESDGRTKFQKDYAGNSKHLIESAFLTMKGDTLIKRALDKGASSTAKELKERLAQKGNRMKTSKGSQDTEDALSIFSKQLRKY